MSSSRGRGGRTPASRGAATPAKRDNPSTRGGAKKGTAATASDASASNSATTNSNSNTEQAHPVRQQSVEEPVEERPVTTTAPSKAKPSASGARQPASHSGQTKSGWGAGQSSNGGELDEPDDRDSEPEIPTIPDAYEDGVTQQLEATDNVGEVTLAPNVVMNKIATHRELEADLETFYPFMTLGDVDLKPLAKYLVAEAEIEQETEDMWTWEQLYTDVSSELLKELEHDVDGLTELSKMGMQMTGGGGGNMAGFDD